MRAPTTVSARLHPWALLSLLALTAIGAAVPSGAAAPEAVRPVGRQPGTTTVFLVRHAERAAPGDPEFDPSDPSDPPLNAAGRARAQELARVLEEAGVTAVYASQFKRTQQTVEPLAQRAGVPVTVHDARDSAGLAALIARGDAGGVVVVAGHSNTVPELIEALGAPPVAPIEDAWEYDNLFVVTRGDAGEATVQTLKYGAESVSGG
ncbi:MAG: phosphoglycerate mutase family protein [Acidobacteriota bacterium]|jgi:phosphohistidine phosphatase SixA